MSKYKKHKITDLAKESAGIYSSGSSIDLLDPQLHNALSSSISILPVTADSTKVAYRSILSTIPGDIESTEVQLLYSSQGVESNPVAIDAIEGR